MAIHNLKQEKNIYIYIYRPKTGRMYYYTVRLFFHLCRRNVDKKEKYEETEEEKNRREIKKKEDAMVTQTRGGGDAK